jgi:hypothetical protein
MRLVPRQLKRAGMTGDVPYYGGRFSPEQAYAVSHPSAPPPRSISSRVPTPTASRPASLAFARSGGNALLALQHLLDAGVLTPAEYEELRGRVPA